MRHNNASMGVDTDFSEAGYVLGKVDGMMTQMRTDRFNRAVIEYAHGEMAEQFDADIDAVAIASPNNFHHVYEWRMTGLPQGRLWKHRLRGRGGSRQAQFEWKASRAPILTPQERYANAYGISERDPIRNVDPEVLEKLSGRTYFFYWKAPVMEYNITTNITPRWSPVLFVPDEGEKRGYRFEPNMVSVVNPGGDQTFMRFSNFWMGWWSVRGPEIFNGMIRKTIEKDLGRIEAEGVNKSRARVSTFALTSDVGPGGFTKAYKDGKKYAEAMIDSIADKYYEEGISDDWGGEEW